MFGNTLISLYIQPQQDTHILLFYSEDGQQSLHLKRIIIWTLWSLWLHRHEKVFRNSNPNSASFARVLDTLSSTLIQGVDDDYMVLRSLPPMLKLKRVLKL